MALKVKVEDKSLARGPLVIPGRRLYLTSDRDRLVEEGSREARYLYCNTTTAVPRKEYEALLGKVQEPQPERKTEPEPEAKPRKTRKVRKRSRKTDADQVEESSPVMSDEEEPGAPHTD